jgi:chaperonin GroEL
MTGRSARRGRDARHQGRGRRGHRRGGGVALLRASAVLATLTVAGDERIGVDIAAACGAGPMHWIAANAGEEGAVVVEHVRENRTTPASTRTGQ